MLKPCNLCILVLILDKVYSRNKSKYIVEINQSRSDSHSFKGKYKFQGSLPGPCLHWTLFINYLCTFLHPYHDSAPTGLPAVPSHLRSFTHSELSLVRPCNVTPSRNSNHPLNLSSTVLLLESISWSPSLIEMFTSLLPYNPVHVIAFLKLLRNCYFICLFPTLNK